MTEMNFPLPKGKTGVVGAEYHAMTLRYDGKLPAEIEMCARESLKWRSRKN